MPSIDTRTLLTLLNKDPLGIEGNVSDASVESRCVNEYDYDLVTETLTVSFPGSGGTGGEGTWTYLQFPLQQFVEFATSFSLGTYFNLYIRGQYTTRRIA